MLKQKSYNFTTNMLKAYLSAQVSSLSAFVISKTHTVAQKPRGRQLKAKVYSSKSTIFRILSSFFITTFVQTTITQNGSSTHLDFSTKQMLITVHSFPATQCHHSLKFTMVDKSHSQHSVVAVRCEGRHFLTLYACIHVVSF